MGIGIDTQLCRTNVGRRLAHALETYPASIDSRIDKGVLRNQGKQKCRAIFPGNRRSISFLESKQSFKIATLCSVALSHLALAFPFLLASQTPVKHRRQLRVSKKSGPPCFSTYSQQVAATEGFS
jgi:hypothetical protein